MISYAKKQTKQTYIFNIFNIQVKKNMHKW